MQVNQRIEQIDDLLYYSKNYLPVLKSGTFAKAYGGEFLEKAIADEESAVRHLKAELAVLRCYDGQTVIDGAVLCE